MDYVIKVRFKRIKSDLYSLMTDSQDWWLPIMAIMVHFLQEWLGTAGTYRVGDGRGALVLEL